MKTGGKTIMNSINPILNKDSSDLFYGIYPFREKNDDLEVFGDRFGVKSINQVVFHFENIYKLCLADRSSIDVVFENFENEYKKFFKEETSIFSPLWIFRSGKLYEFEFDPFISLMDFSYISEFSECYLINRNGDSLFLSEYLLDLFNNEFKLFSIIDNGESLELEDVYEDEIYPDIFFELKNKEFLNDQGFYKDLYQEIISRIFFE